MKKILIFIFDFFMTLRPSVQITILITIGILLTILVLFLAVKIDEIIFFITIIIS